MQYSVVEFMDNKRKLSEKMMEQKNRIIIEQLWLNYYNDTLFAKGLITEDQRNRMHLLIRNRTVKQKK